ncbi:MAG: septum formation protein Maf [Planctomycetales bacterium]|nr:septum formation protein Maf [Planctomycetales bacterium]
MSMSPLVLASQSPRRQRLLAEADLRFRIIAPAEEAEDDRRHGESVEDYVSRLARQKFAHVRDQVAADEVVLTCDTVAECCDEVLGKPRDRDHAREILQRLSGRVHRVVSGVCLSRLADGRQDVRTAESTLRMASLSERQLEDYLDTGLWEGKAGAFGFQDGIDWVELLAGEESNVVGLPMALVKQMLAEWGLAERERGSTE